LTAGLGPPDYLANISRHSRAGAQTPPIPSDYTRGRQRAHSRVHASRASVSSGSHFAHTASSLGGVDSSSFDPRWEPLVRVSTGQFSLNFKFQPKLLLAEQSLKSRRGSISDVLVSIEEAAAEEKKAGGDKTASPRTAAGLESKVQSPAETEIVHDLDSDDGAEERSRRAAVKSDVMIEVGFRGLTLSLSIPYREGLQSRERIVFLLSKFPDCCAQCI